MVDVERFNVGDIRRTIETLAEHSDFSECRVCDQDAARQLHDQDRNRMPFIKKTTAMLQVLNRFFASRKGNESSEELNVEFDRILDDHDLLLENQQLTASIRNRSIMVTGAGGSIGSALCRNILRFGPRRMVLVERSEYALYSIDRELRKMKKNDPSIGEVEIVPCLADCGDRPRMTSIMRDRHIDIVYHAAAFKHVPIVERNEVEGIRNNSFATWRSALAAVEADVSMFVLVSTDKAVRPSGMMGATKRLAEMIVQSLSMETTDRENGTRFAIVRFGNVIGSSGSVVPLFEEQISDGGPVTITHPEATRYFMTIPQAAALVMQAGTIADEVHPGRETGEIFVLDMGEAVSIVDLARHMIRRAGRTHGKGQDQIDIIYTGLRPGEKLHEELTLGDEPKETSHPSIRRCKSKRLTWNTLEPRLHRLEAATDRHDVREARRLVESFMPDYQPLKKPTSSLHEQGQ